MRLFNVGKVGCFLDDFKQGVEKRKGKETKVLHLKFRVTPLTAERASTMPDAVKPMLFRLSDGKPKDGMKLAAFTIENLKRQRLTVFATPDTEKPSFAIDAVDVSSVRARMAKNRTDFDLLFTGTFGPFANAELDAVSAWHLSQRFITFEESEIPLALEGDDSDDGVTDRDEKARQAARPAPEWDDDGTGSGKPADAETPATADAMRSVGVRQRPISHAKKDKRRRKDAADVVPFTPPADEGAAADAVEQ